MNMKTCQVQTCKNLATNLMINKYDCEPSFKIETPLCPDHYEEMGFEITVSVSFERIPLENLIQ